MPENNFTVFDQLINDMVARAERMLNEMNAHNVSIKPKKLTDTQTDNIKNEVRPLSSALTPEFTDAQKMRELFPKTFEAPDVNKVLDVLSILPDNEEDDVIVDVFAKLCVEKERFWVRLTNYKDGFGYGIVWNDLVRTEQHGIKFGLFIKFKPADVYGLM